MAISPTEKRYGEAVLTLSQAAGTRTVTATCAGGAYPAKNLASASTTLTVNLAEGTTGLTPPTGSWGLAAVRDNTDVAGDYNGPAAVLAYVALGTGGALPASVSLGPINERGHFRLVLMVGDTPANAQDITGVGGTNGTYHFDSDNNNAEGTLSLLDPGATRVTGYNWRNTKLASRSYSQAGNLRYAHTTTITVDFDSGTYINPKAIKVALKTSGADGTPQDGIYRPTPSTAGSATTVSIPVDTDFLAAATGYFLHVCIGAALGESLQAGETADFLTSGTITGTAADERHWLQFDNNGQTLSGFTGSGNDRIVSDAADKTIGSGIFAKKDSAGTIDGVGCFSSSGYTTVQRLFNRTYEASTQNANPFLEVYAFDAYGAALASISFQVQVERHSDNADENAQTIVTDVNGRIRWNYTIANNHTAFNRYKTALNTVDSEATAPVTIPASDVPGSHPFADDIFTGPYPAYPKYVRLVGNAFAGVKEPNDLESSVFGVNSEGWSGVKGSRTSPTGGTYTSDAGQATDDANGVPTGVGRRTKGLATGAARVKPWTAEYDEGNNEIEFPSRYALRDVAGRQIPTTATSDFWFGRWGSWSVTFSTVDVAVGDMSGSGSNDMRLQGSLGYSPAFLSLPAAADPSIVAILIGFADVSATRDSFGFTSDMAYGFSSDVGNYGALKQIFQWIAVDPDLNFYVAADKTSLPPGDTIIVQAQMLRKLPDQSSAPIEPDAPLHIDVYRRNPSGSPTVIASEDMVDSGDGINFTYTRTFAADGSENAPYYVLVTGFKDGSRPPDAGDIGFTVGVQDLNLVLLAGDTPVATAEAGNHIRKGKSFLVGVGLFSRTTRKFVTVDSAPTVIVIGFVRATGQAVYLDSDLTWKNLDGTNAAYEWPTVLDPNPNSPNVYLLQFSDAQSDTIFGDGTVGLTDMVYMGKCFKGLVPYNGQNQIRPSGPSFLHNATGEASIPFTATGGHSHIGVAEGTVPASTPIGDRS